MYKTIQSATRYLLITAALSGLSACDTEKNATSAQVMLGIAQPEKLRVGEGFVQPIGYYESLPRFSWVLPDAPEIQFQSAYQIQVASTPENFAAPDLWDSEKVASDSTSWLRYEGEALNSRQTIYWRVRVWNENDQASNWSETQSLELGLLNNSDWQAKWIGHPDTAITLNPSQATLATPQYLRTTFNTDKQIEKARLYITAKGVFKPFINGKEVAEKDVMTPGWTPYAKRIESLTYDVTDLIQSGDNVLAASLAGGWYSGRAFNQHDTDHRKPPRLLAQLEITYADGSVQTVASNNSWTATQQGPIRFASNYDGERYDQSLEMPGWTNAGFDSSDWQTAIETALDNDVAISPKRHAPIRITETLPVQSIVSQDGDVVVLDFGQNMVGVPQINVPAIKGKEIKVRFAEALHKGEFYTENYRSAHSTNYFLPAETGVITYTPTFTYHGYRYIEISGFDESHTPSKDWATALVQHSDVNIHASFESSHEKLNQFSQNVIWGMRSNFYDIPLDCPQRDERLGWTGDAQVFVTPSMYMADVYGFWSAWLQSAREEQTENGKIPLYIPHIEWNILDWASSGWGDAVTIIPWELYQVTGDKTILADNYDMMRRWLEHHELKSENYISNMNTFGDWVQPHPVILREGDNGNRGNTDFNYIGTVYYARSVELAMKTAEVLNKSDDVAELKQLHSDIKSALLNHFFDEDLNPNYGIPTQTTYLLGLAYDLFPETKRELAVDKLIALIREADTHLRTGFLGTPLLTQVLQKVGRSDVMFEILFKETYPSWFYSLNNGATTTWERWNSYSIEDGFNPQGMNSLNHYAYGTVSRWFYEGILGITPAEPGFKSIRIEPMFTEKLNHASGGYNTPNGRVDVAWAISNGRLSMDIAVPKNTTANIVLSEEIVSDVLLNAKPVNLNNMPALSPGNYQLSANIKL